MRIKFIAVALALATWVAVIAFALLQQSSAQPYVTAINYNRGFSSSWWMGGMMAPSSTYGSYQREGDQDTSGISSVGMRCGMPMMGAMIGYYPQAVTPLSHEEARRILDGYLTSLANDNYVVGEFEEYSHNFYASIIDRRTGQGVFELLIDRYSGATHLEPQSMMWNSRYGMMGAYRAADMIINQQEALKIAQHFLETAYPGTNVSEIVAYPGYYTIMTTLDGRHYGMLSVNGYSGEVWYHTWHGAFISEVEYGS